MHRNGRARGRLQFSFSPAESLQRREGLLNPTTFFFAESDVKARAARDAARNVWPVEGSADWRQAMAQAMARAARLLPQAPTLAAGAWHQLRLRPFRPVELVAVDQCEQPPRAESRIALGRHCDRFGCPLPELDWRIDGQTTASLRRLHGLLAAMFRQLGIGEFSSRLLDDPQFAPRYTDCAHPTGATRMSRSDANGVVDTDCRVHGLRNLFVAGSSVFPVGGQANPTLAIIALAARLAAHLRAEWGQLSN
jgi:choline dehydrogenase-like flavoprotein